MHTGHKASPVQRLVRTHARDIMVQTRMVCARCGYQAHKKSQYMNHIERKRMCDPVISNVVPTADNYLRVVVDAHTTAPIRHGALTVIVGQDSRDNGDDGNLDATHAPCVASDTAQLIERIAAQDERIATQGDRIAAQDERIAAQDVVIQELRQELVKLARQQVAIQQQFLAHVLVGRHVTPKAKGEAYERAVLHHLSQDRDVVEAYLWSQCPSSVLQEAGLLAAASSSTPQDTGIDIIVRRAGGAFQAVQCKAYADKQALHQKDLAGFYGLLLQMRKANADASGLVYYSGGRLSNVLTRNAQGCDVRYQHLDYDVATSAHAAAQLGASVANAAASLDK